MVWLSIKLWGVGISVARVVGLSWHGTVRGRAFGGLRLAWRGVGIYRWEHALCSGGGGGGSDR